MWQVIGVFIVNHVPMNILELGLYHGWTVYDVLEMIFC